MDASLDFLAQLELSGDADARDVRRAYALKLKRIDQQADPEGFQALRRAYEIALDWVEWKTQQGGAPDAPPEAALEAPPDPPAAPPDEDELAGAVFELFAGQADALARTSRLHDRDAWNAMLCGALDDERLLGLDARMYFEQRIVLVLARGWHPGHEALLAAATELFGWADNRRALERFGYPGDVLNQAIDEQALFERQPEPVRAAMAALIGKLREDIVPPPELLPALMPDLERALEHFPALMSVTAHPDTIDTWYTAWQALPAARSGKAADIEDPSGAPRRRIGLGCSSGSQPGAGPGA
ncbi:hypothetical protein [Massilia niastensis]|uniref:hypothetical protein n=1 Tax=Massilia niastensis TaxID=544911 RepID=UPI000379F343|nr:hypothetical protein [Massilia niastensis]